MTRSFASLVALSIFSSGCLSQDEHQSLQEGRFHHALARAVIHKAHTAEAEEHLWSAPNLGMGAKIFSAGLGGKAKEALQWGQAAGTPRGARGC